MQEGYVLLEKNQSIKACDIWSEFWDKLKTRFKPEFVDVIDGERGPISPKLKISSIYKGCLCEVKRSLPISAEFIRFHQKTLTNFGLDQLTIVMCNDILAQ